MKLDARRSAALGEKLLAMASLGVRQCSCSLYGASRSQASLDCMSGGYSLCLRMVSISSPMSFSRVAPLGTGGRTGGALGARNCT